MARLFNIHSISERDGNYVAGFVDGEGSFYMSTRKSIDRRQGWRFALSFSIGNNDKRVLEFCRSKLQCGTLRNVDTKKYLYEVSDLTLLENNILPFFKRFQFVSVKKRHEFRVFQLLLRIFQQGPIDSISKLQRILFLRMVLSRFRTPRASFRDSEILSTFIPDGGSHL
jgi:hypothetical protein